MRLSQDEHAAITEAVHSVFGENAEVRLFGSRTQDSRRGGDIDLYIEVEPDRYSYERELDLHTELWKRIGEQKVDILVHKRGQPRTPIERIAVNTGVPL